MLIKFILSDESSTKVLRELVEGVAPEELHVEVEDEFGMNATLAEPEKEDVLWYGKYLPKDEVRALMYDTFADQSKGGIRRWLNENWVDQPSRECPKDNCETTATTEQIEDFFGYRQIGGRPFPQSYCRDCRSSHKKKSNTDKE